jgi:ABC-type transport system involved in Fe-S cluster assembly fused permease/ATPase subunit
LPSAAGPLGVEAYRRALYQPYAIHTNRNSSDFVTAIHTKVNEVVFGTLLPFLQLVISILLTISITAVLLLMDSVMASRALYRQASVLVFDEATSALDNTKEKA